MRRIVVIGAGPIGLAAAAGASERGHDVTVLEAGEVGASLRTWGATRFFTPLSMNVRSGVMPRCEDSAESPGMCEGDSAASVRRGMTDLLTGPEYIDRVLLPLASRLNVRTNTRVVSITRRGLTRTDFAGHPLRAEKPFRILTANDELFEADVVLDASGSTSPIPFPARGVSSADMIRTLGELESRKDELRVKSVLVAGHGHSAAHAVSLLHDAGIAVRWAVRTPNLRPCEEIANDPLPERKRVITVANELARTIPVERRATIESIHGRDVTLTGNRRVEADVIVALTGYRPLDGFTTELALETSPVNEGGARLYRAISKITDCLSVPKLSNDDLASGEPNYFFIGARAYGRSRTFLLQTGFAQVEAILDSLQ